MDRPLPIPARPVLPIISKDDAEHIPDEVWSRIVRRDMLRRFYAEELEAIIYSTRQGRPPGHLPVYSPPKE